MALTFAELLEERLRHYKKSPKAQDIPWTYQMFEAYINEQTDQTTQFVSEARLHLQTIKPNIKSANVSWNSYLLKLLQVVSPLPSVTQKLRDYPFSNNIPWSYEEMKSFGGSSPEISPAFSASANIIDFTTEVARVWVTGDDTMTDWGDGTVELNTYEHSYAANGIYDIVITSANGTHTFISVQSASSISGYNDYAHIYVGDCFMSGTEVTFVTLTNSSGARYPTNIVNFKYIGTNKIVDMTRTLFSYGSAIESIDIDCTLVEDVSGASFSTSQGVLLRDVLLHNASDYYQIALAPAVAMTSVSINNLFTSLGTVPPTPTIPIDNGSELIFNSEVNASYWIGGYSITAPDQLITLTLSDGNGVLHTQTTAINALAIQVLSGGAVFLVVLGNTTSDAPLFGSQVFTPVILPCIMTFTSVPAPTYLFEKGILVPEVAIPSGKGQDDSIATDKGWIVVER